jgi:CBS domain containing-hemolysin-like protein
MALTSPSDSRKTKTASNWLQRLAASLGFASPTNLRDTLQKAISEAGEEEGVLSQEERAMLSGIMGFGTLRVSEVMVPRADIVAIAEHRSMAALMHLFAEAGHSRIPVYRDDLDDPLGMVHIKDAVTWITNNSAGGDESESLDLTRLDLSRTIAAANIVREILFVPSSMHAIDLLATMRAKQIHLAIVVDEFGGTDGLVSIEDLVEAIIGDIADEHDIEEQLIVSAGAGMVDASAKAPIEEVEKALGEPLPVPEGTEQVETLGGLVLAMVGYVPKRGHIVQHPSGVTLEVLDAGPRRINKVRVSEPRALPAPESQPAALLSPPNHASGDGEKRDRNDRRAQAA